jgi:hypothetical protein
VHHLFRKELDAATGRSEFVVALNLDIRGFSNWSLEVDSAQTALFLTKLYARLIDDYFGNASYIKPTGDGLFVVETFEEADLMEVLARTVGNAKTIVDSFSAVCDGEKMINFPTPNEVGIGIARGTASRLASPEVTLDYSGRVLNLASRLMDLARPQGVVIDDGFGLEFLSDDLKGGFTERDVYLKGVSPNKPVKVHCWPEIEIPEIYLHPLNEERWEHETLETSRGQLEQADGRKFRFELGQPPIPGSKLVCEVEHPASTPGGRKAKGRMTTFPFRVDMGEVAGTPVARIDQGVLATRLKTNRVGPTWDVLVKVSYRVM